MFEFDRVLLELVIAAAALIIIASIADASAVSIVTIFRSKLRASSARKRKPRTFRKIRCPFEDVKILKMWIEEHRDDSAMSDARWKNEILPLCRFADAQLTNSGRSFAVPKQTCEELLKDVIGEEEPEDASA